ncbi:hypothetical protein SS50377_28191 [Spironucleus salmonicida]|uniref:NECAP PHear domain-containing protein n=1 Tax=Spironucleus salmonicida TaxID=348837 RepID=V6LRP4_9EUKA|nr:hypothetical protein SS50377_28191 [Spironucleus salmonicida]|eukprot:EST46366.1 hypothetical protein SS50377_13609 [Spironucleus salmonicida]
MAFEQTVAILKDSFAYRIAPTLNIDNFTCESWPQDWLIFRGQMKIVTTDTQCFVILLNPDNTEQTRFPVQYRGSIPVLNQASDSSRYFVLVVMDPTGTRQAFVGIGFADRETAFDFKVQLADFGKWLERSKNPQPIQAMPVQDFSLKADQKIKISIGGKTKNTASKPVNSFSGMGPE